MPFTEENSAIAAAQDSTVVYTIDTTQRAAVELFYKTIFSSSSNVPSGWNGSISSCDAGDTTAAYKAAVLRRINWFRAMAGVPADIQFDPVSNQKAQQAALIMAANNQLDHFPPAHWTCYNATAREAASQSNLALGMAGADSIVGYISDGGSNNAAVGHRRWLLYPTTRFMGTGDVDGTNRANALWVFDGSFGAARPPVRDDFVAWPPRGYVPYQTVYPRWSFSYPQADFSNASLSMTINGQPLATRREALNNGYGENTLVWFPGSYSDGQNWAKPAADMVYQVTLNNVLVAGVARTFSYTVTVFDPDSAGSSPVISGSSSLQLLQNGNYSLTTQAGATGYQWRSVRMADYALTDGAEAGLDNFVVNTSSGYSPLTSDTAAGGANSFHLAHPEFANQTLQFKSEFLANDSSLLRFSSRLGLSTTSQEALVEISADEGATWTVVFQQKGVDAAEPSFTSKSVSLAAYAGRIIWLRFAYDIDCSTSCSAYPQTSTGIGWYIDNIQLSDISTVIAKSVPAATDNSSFTFSSQVSGQLLLQARPGMYGYYGEWGITKLVTVSTEPGGGPSGPIDEPGEPVDDPSVPIGGTPASPQLLSNRLIPAGTFLQHVIIGVATTFEAGVTLGTNVSFVSNAFIPAGINLTPTLPKAPQPSGMLTGINLSTDVLRGVSPSILVAVQQLPQYRTPGSNVRQDSGTGVIRITTNDSHTAVLPVKVTQKSAMEAAGSYVDEDGNLVLITSTGRAVVAYPMLLNSAYFQQSLVHEGLNSTLSDKGNLVVRPASGGSYYSTRPVSAIAAFHSNNEGLLAHALGSPANLPAYSLVFRNENGALLEQMLVPVPADWSKLKQTLNSIPGIENVRIDGEGIISVKLNGFDIRARTGYLVVPGGAPHSGNVVLQATPDLNGDGTGDYVITYANGEQQSLYIYP